MMMMMMMMMILIIDDYHHFVEFLRSAISANRSTIFVSPRKRWTNLRVKSSCRSLGLTKALKLP